MCAKISLEDIIAGMSWFYTVGWQRALGPWSVAEETLSYLSRPQVSPSPPTAERPAAAATPDQKKGVLASFQVSIPRPGTSPVEYDEPYSVPIIMDRLRVAFLFWLTVTTLTKYVASISGVVGLAKVAIANSNLTRDLETIPRVEAVIAKWRDLSDDGWKQVALAIYDLALLYLTITARFILPIVPILYFVWPKKVEESNQWIVDSIIKWEKGPFFIKVQEIMKEPPGVAQTHVTARVTGLARRVSSGLLRYFSSPQPASPTS